MPVTFKDIERAAEALDGQVVQTPTLPAPKLSKLTGAEVYVKYENFQVTNSFKDRGAFIKLTSLDDEQKRIGVIAMSAGNHAQAAAYHAQRLQVPATIVMPETTPFTKVEQTKSYGANIELKGETLDDCRTVTEEMIADKGYTLVHPYDDDHIIAGQGTVGLEMIAQVPELEVIIGPIGGGGLMAGSAIAAKHVKPDVEMIGSEAGLYPSMYHAVRGQHAQCGGQTLADGIAVKNVSDRTISVCKELLDDIILAGEPAIEQAVDAYIGMQKTSAEGAGAVPLAALMVNRDRFRGRKVGLILSGGNIDTRILASILYRELERQQRIVNFRVQINDRPGVLGMIACLLGDAGANILEVSHRRMFLDTPAKGAELDFMVETRDAHHAEEIIAKIEAQGFRVSLLDAPGGREAMRSPLAV
ncbi:MAG: threonine ammonia-lyase [Hyphomicrobiales bacterium]